MKKYLFVINPASGGFDKSELVAEITRQCHEHNLDFEMMKTTGADDAERVTSRIEHFRPDLLVIAGGDGTINMLATVVMKHRLKLGIIPSGSANGLAKELGITMENAFPILLQGNKRLLDVISINNHITLHMADLGLNASLVRRYEEEERRGFIGYAISAIKEISSLEEQFTVTMDGDRFQKQCKTSLLVIANSRMYGTGYEINPAGKLGDGLVEICVLKELSAELIRDELFHQLQKEHRTELFEVFPVSKIKIRCSRPINFQSDGEYLGEVTQVTVQVLPGPIEVIA